MEACVDDLKTTQNFPLCKCYFLTLGSKYYIKIKQQVREKYLV
jgi:hypothetical protein